METEFLSYVGGPDLHDGTVVRATHDSNRATVVVRGNSGREYTIQFDGVSLFRANSENGMLLYALSEMRASVPLRRFVFVNWNEDDDASLEVIAKSIEIK